MDQNIFNPETCSLDELKARIDELENTEEFYNTMQLSTKIFINSVYGVFGTAFFNLADSDIAESITLQGQDLIKFSVNEINDYINNLWNKDYEGHKRIADRLKKIFGDSFNYDQFLESAKKNKISLETAQVYGDSIVGDSWITLSDDSFMMISDLFNEGTDIEIDQFGKERVRSNRSIYCVDLTTGKIDKKPIKYVMRHKVNKRLYKVFNDDTYVVCTEDHSLLKYYDTNFKEVKPDDIDKDTFLFLKGENDLLCVSGFSVECVSNRNVAYVYDIEVDSDTDNYHNFFANGILVHNTDSVSKDTIIRTKKHVDGITIEDFYEENSEKDVFEIKTESGKIIRYNKNDKVKVKRSDKIIYVYPDDILYEDEIFT